MVSTDCWVWEPKTVLSGNPRITCPVWFLWSVKPECNVGGIDSGGLCQNVIE